MNKHPQIEKPCTQTDTITKVKDKKMESGCKRCINFLAFAALYCVPHFKSSGSLFQSSALMNCICKEVD